MLPLCDLKIFYYYFTNLFYFSFLYCLNVLTISCESYPQKLQKNTEIKKFIRSKMFHRLFATTRNLLVKLLLSRTLSFLCSSGSNGWRLKYHSVARANAFSYLRVIRIRNRFIRQSKNLRIHLISLLRMSVRE